MKPQFRDIRHHLKYVGMKRDDYDLSKFPDFLIVGPQRTATTWLHLNLNSHPQVFIPWSKELYYFNNLEHPEYHPASLPPMDRELGWYLEQFEVPNNIRENRMAHCEQVYGQPFAPQKFGEATATYAAVLHAGIIKEILTLNPDIKIILVVRNPIDRAWSHAKKDLCKERKRPIADVSREEWLRFFNNTYQVQCGHFSRFLPVWEKMIPKDNLMIVRLLDISKEPREMMERVYDLVGVDTRNSSSRFWSAGASMVPRNVGEHVNLTESVGIPEDLLGELQKIYGDEVVYLRDRGLI